MLAAAVALALSPLELFGPVAAVEPTPGIHADWTVLGLGTLALAVILGAVAAAISFRLAPHRVARRAAAGSRGSGTVAAALAAFARERRSVLAPPASLVGDEQSYYAALPGATQAWYAAFLAGVEERRAGVR